MEKRRSFQRNNETLWTCLVPPYAPLHTTSLRFTPSNSLNHLRFPLYVLVHTLIPRALLPLPCYETAPY